MAHERRPVEGRSVNPAGFRRAGILWTGDFATHEVTFEQYEALAKESAIVIRDPETRELLSLNSHAKKEDGQLPRAESLLVENVELKAELHRVTGDLASLRLASRNHPFDVAALESKIGAALATIESMGEEATRLISAEHGMRMSRDATVTAYEALTGKCAELEGRCAQQLVTLAEYDAKLREVEKERDSLLDTPASAPTAATKPDPKPAPKR